MNSLTFAVCQKIVPAGYVQQCIGAKNKLSNDIRELLEKRKIPQSGWDDATIEYLLLDIAFMDSNNFPGNCGVGEREGRIYSQIVSRRHFRFAHGIGRSGDITAMQPKAAGSSLLYSLTNSLVLDSLHIAGVQTCAACIVVPMATGMSLVLCMQSFRSSRPSAKYVLWPRIDQKSCFKSILTAGFEPVVVENKLEGDQLVTDVVCLEENIQRLGADSILCLLSTTSCFAPRGIDRLEEISTLCAKWSIPHLVNNAYGVQSSKCMHVLQQAARSGRVDAFVQSTDKNYLVPVGGAVIAGFDKSIIEKIAETYPGRASSTPIHDVFITLMSMGVSGYKKLLADRKEMYKCLRGRMETLATAYGEKVLHTPDNPISIAVTLSARNLSALELTKIGSMLFTRNTSGMRVVTGEKKETISGHVFTGFGAHYSSYPHAYFTTAASIGMTKADIDLFCKRLEKVLRKLYTVKASDSDENVNVNANVKATLSS